MIHRCYRLITSRTNPTFCTSSRHVRPHHLKWYDKRSFVLTTYAGVITTVLCLRTRQAMRACDSRDPPLYHEKAYALARTNNTKEALHIMVTEIGDIRQAVDFVVATDKALWPELVKLCLPDQQLVAALLEYIGYYSLNPLELLSKVCRVVSALSG